MHIVYLQMQSNYFDFLFLKLSCDTANWNHKNKISIQKDPIELLETII